MKMGVKVYYAEISGHKEVKKHQQRVMMILESKMIPYEAVDITEPGKEVDKDFMMKNAKPRGDSKFILSPQIFNDEIYCGDYDDFDLANENDVLEDFLHTPKIDRKFSLNGAQNGTGSRESSAEAEISKLNESEAAQPAVTSSEDAAPKSGTDESAEVSSTTPAATEPTSTVESDPAQDENITEGKSKEEDE